MVRAPILDPREDIMLDAETRTQLQSYLERLVAPIELHAFLDDSPTASSMRSLLESIEPLSPLIRLVSDGAAGPRRPSFGIARAGERPRVWFSGLPMGHEFTSLILALLHVGGYPPRVEAPVLDAVRNLPGGGRWTTWVSMSCQNCPDVVQALNTLAALHPGFEHEMVDGALFPDEVKRLSILSVPAVYLDGQPFAQGRMELGDVVRRLDTQAADREATRLDAEAPFDVLVVGGGPAGASAAIYAARKGIRTGIVAERFGGQVLDTLGIENFISVRYTEGPDFAAALDEHMAAYPVQRIARQRATAFRPGEEGAPHEVVLASGATLRGRTVILAPGARWRELSVPGEAEYRTRGVTFCPHCDGPLFKGKAVAVVGGGNSGVEAAIDLAGLVRHVVLLEYDTDLRADAVLRDRLASLPNVEVRTMAQTTRIVGDGSRVTGLQYLDRTVGETRELLLDGVFVQIGLLPNTEWLAGVIPRSKHGEIEVDLRGATAIPGVFAAGDATTTPWKQIIIAMGEGARASLSAFDWLIRQPIRKPPTEAA